MLPALAHTSINLSFLIRINDLVNIHFNNIIKVVRKSGFDRFLVWKFYPLEKFDVSCFKLLIFPSFFHSFRNIFILTVKLSVSPGNFHYFRKILALTEKFSLSPGNFGSHRKIFTLTEKFSLSPIFFHSHQKIFISPGFRKSSLPFNLFIADISQNHLTESQNISSITVRKKIISRMKLIAPEENKTKPP